MIGRALVSEPVEGRLDVIRDGDVGSARYDLRFRIEPTDLEAPVLQMPSALGGHPLVLATSDTDERLTSLAWGWHQQRKVIEQAGFMLRAVTVVLVEGMVLTPSVELDRDHCGQAGRALCKAVAQRVLIEPRHGAMALIAAARLRRRWMASGWLADPQLATLLERALTALTELAWQPAQSGWSQPDCVPIACDRLAELGHDPQALVADLDGLLAPGAFEAGWRGLLERSGLLNRAERDAIGRAWTGATAEGWGPVYSQSQAEALLAELEGPSCSS